MRFYRPRHLLLSRFLTRGLLLAFLSLIAVGLLMARLTRENYVQYAADAAQERVDRVARRIAMQMSMGMSPTGAPPGASERPGMGSASPPAGMMEGRTPVQQLIKTELEYGAMTRLDVINAAGEIVGSGDPERIGQTADLEAVTQARESGQVVSRIVETEAGDVLQYVAPIDVGGEQYVVAVDEPLTDVDAALQKNRNSVLAALTAGFALMFVVLGFVVWNAGLDLEYHQQEENRVKDLLGRYVSHQVAQQILADGSLNTSGERRPITVLFADIRGFTRFSEELPPEEVVALLNEFLEAMTEVVFRYDGTLDKFLGDGLMVIFGAPATAQNSADRALACAQEMQARFRQLQEQWGRDRGAADLGLGIGVNTGDAIVGSIGSVRRLDYTAIGDVVNVAARLEGIAGAGQILLSETTYALLGRPEQVVSLGPQQLKGKRRPVPVFVVTAAAAASEAASEA